METSSRRAALRGWLHDWGTIPALAFGLYAIAFWLWQIFQWGGQAPKAVVGDLAALPGALAAALFAWRAGSHSALDPRARRGWRLIGLAYIVYWAGDALYAYYELLLGVRPFPSWADVGYLLFYPVLLLGLLSFPVSRRGRGERVKFWLDAGTVLLAGWMIIWHLVLGPAALASKADPVTTALSVIYPLGDLGLLFGIVAIVLRRPEESNRKALAILAGGLLLFLAADLASGYLSLLNTHERGGWPDALWMGASLLAVLSAHYQYTQASQGVAAVTALPRDRQYSLAPYAAVIVGNLVLLIAAGQQAASLMGGLLFGAIGIIGLVMARQITVMNENLRLMTELHTLAVTDSLTGLPNRRYFFSLAAERVSGASPGGASAIMVDLDDFKDVNDRYGHEAGDQLLVALADRLRTCVRSSDVVARLGGDEFAILLNGAQAPGYAAHVAERVIEALRRPFALRHGEVVIGASAGVAWATSGQDDAEELLRHADLAMYTAKRRGKGHYEIFDPIMATGMAKRDPRVPTMRPA